MKDALVSAHEKFPTNSSVENLNVLFLSGGYVDSLNQYYMNFCGADGFFTGTPFHPAEEFQLVGVVILSNLMYWHEQSAATHDWSLRDVFLLPLVNQHHRSSLMSEPLIEGLSVFDHHVRRFNKFADAGTSDFPSYVRKPFKLLHYIHDDLSQTELKRYFPVQTQPLGRVERSTGLQRKP